MDKKTRAALAKSYGDFTTEELQSKLEQAKAFLANPGDATAETIQGANDAVEFLTELLSKPGPEAQPEAKAEKPFEEKHAKLIEQKMLAGLTRQGAIEVIKHQIENDARRKAAEKK